MSTVNLRRFLDAQDGVYVEVRRELVAGRKQTHWMWFVFPQIAGLGRSPMARRYAIASLAEARAYLAHPVLGPRLIDCARLVTAWAGRRSIDQILGFPDDLKFHSCMTLFARAAADPRPFQEALDAHFASQPDGATLERLRALADAPG